jgi:hypothetical protein
MPSMKSSNSASAPTAAHHALGTGIKAIATASSANGNRKGQRSRECGRHAKIQNRPVRPLLDTAPDGVRLNGQALETKFTKEFKAETVALIRSSAKPISAAG